MLRSLLEAIAKVQARAHDGERGCLIDVMRRRDREVADDVAGSVDSSPVWSRRLDYS